MPGRGRRVSRYSDSQTRNSGDRFAASGYGCAADCRGGGSGNQTTESSCWGRRRNAARLTNCWRAGADAYIVRTGPSRHLNEAIRYVQDGGKYLSPQLTKDVPVSLNGHSNGTHAEAVSQLHAAMEAQALTVARLEEAMGRAQYAIEILQQKVEQLTGAPIEPPGSERSWNLPGVRTVMSTVAAALIVAVLGLQPAAVASARLLLHDRQYPAAEKLCRMVLKQDPGSLAASRILAAALLHEDRTYENGR